jgi:branched-chain amino acid transport system permease protein
VLPYVFTSGAALTMLSLMGIMIVFTLSYNMLLGQTGMLSFGHAVYYGLGAFFTVHVMNFVIRNGLPVPVPVIPIVGGLFGLVFGILFGWVSTKRGGTAFAMISLGLAELVASSANILRGFFGGEEGITTNARSCSACSATSFGPQIQVYLPHRRLVRAVHDPHVRHHPHAARAHVQRGARERRTGAVRRLRLRAWCASSPFCLASFFAGVAGSLRGRSTSRSSTPPTSASGNRAVVLLAAYRRRQSASSSARSSAP